MTRDINDKKSMKNKIINHSNLIVIIKTNENKIFGGYTNCKIEYNREYKKDNKSYLFSIDLNEKFNIKEDAKYAIIDDDKYGICFGSCELVLFNNCNECFSFFGRSGCKFDNKGIKREEFCGGTKRNDDSNNFKPIEIEIYEIIN